MTETQAISPAMLGNRILRFTAFLFGGVAYLTFLFTILYAIGFVSGLIVPKTIDTGAKSGIFEAIVVDLALMSLFAIQHSVMARKSFKHWWTQFIPRSVERSTYVLCASLTLVLLFWQWRPMPAVIWNIQEPDMAVMIATLSFVGWVIVFTSTFLINHFELFGLHQVANNLMGRESVPDAILLSFCPPPDLSRFHHRVLGGPDDERRAFAVRGGDHGLHLRRHHARRARPRRHVRRRISPLPGARFDAVALAQIELTISQLSERRRKNHEAYWKLFLRCSRGPGHGRAGRDGLLPLQFVPVVVRWTGERVHPVEARSGADHGGGAARRDVREDSDEPAQVLRGVRRSSDDQPSDARAG